MIPECPKHLPKGSWYGDGPDGTGWYAPDVALTAGVGISGTLYVDPRLPPFVCRFDDTPHPTLEALHAHLKRFKVSRERYYSTYYPKVDPVSGKPIPFKDLDQYLEQSFESKVTLRKWMAAQPDKGLSWAKEWLLQRKAEKGLTYAPSQVELKTLCCPSMPYYEAVAGGYYTFTRELGYADRYTLAPLTFAPLAADARVICDTREQAPIKLPIATDRGTLNVGDYALAAPYDLGVRIERKSLADWCGTLSGRKVTHEDGTEDSPFARFDRELARAAAANLYVVMMVESPINHAQAFNKLPQTRWIKASPSHVLHNLRALLVKYPLTFQCVFTDGRIEMARVMMKVFQLGAQVRTIDLQYQLEEGNL